MPIQPGDIKIVPPIQTTQMSDGGRVVPAYKIHFSVRGEGSYNVTLPQAGYTVEKAQAAITDAASHIVDTLDAFK